eukprot:Pgem_evm1s5384
MAPVDVSVPEIADMLLVTTRHLCDRQPIRAGDVILRLDNLNSSNSIQVLQDLELTYKQYDLYLWLALKFGEAYFPDLELVRVVVNSLFFVIICSMLP